LKQKLQYLKLLFGTIPPATKLDGEIGLDALRPRIRQTLQYVPAVAVNQTQQQQQSYSQRYDPSYSRINEISQVDYTNFQV
jgi:hypothetical protein